MLSNTSSTESITSPYNPNDAYLHDMNYGDLQGHIKNLKINLKKAINHKVFLDAVNDFEECKRRIKTCFNDRNIVCKNAVEKFLDNTEILGFESVNMMMRDHHRKGETSLRSSAGNAELEESSEDVILDGGDGLERKSYTNDDLLPSSHSPSVFKLNLLIVSEDGIQWTFLYEYRNTSKLTNSPSSSSSSSSLSSSPYSNDDSDDVDLSDLRFNSDDEYDEDEKIIMRLFKSQADNPLVPCDISSVVDLTKKINAVPSLLGFKLGYLEVFFIIIKFIMFYDADNRNINALFNYHWEYRGYIKEIINSSNCLPNTFIDKTSLIRTSSDDITFSPKSIHSPKVQQKQQQLPSLSPQVSSSDLRRRVVIPALKPISTSPPGSPSTISFHTDTQLSSSMTTVYSPKRVRRTPSDSS